MHHLARGGLLLLLAFCPPAWGDGFCDTLPGHGTGCSQIRSVERDPISGALLPDYSDLDLQTHPFADQPIGFAFDFSEIGVAENKRVIVLELGFAGALPDSRMLTMSVTKNAGYALRFDWLSAAPSWSSAYPTGVPPTAIQSISVTIPALETSAGVVISPSGLNGIDILAGGQFVGNFEFPAGTTPHHALQLRTGVISGPLKDNMATRYEFVSPPLNE